MATTDPLDDNCILMEESEDLRQNRPTGVCYKYAKFLARFWYVMGLVVLVVVTVLAVVTFKVYDLPDFPDPSKGFEARGTLITSRLFSIDNLERHADDLLVTDPSGDVQDENRRYAPSRTKRQASNRTYSGIKFCTSLWSSRGYSTMVFEAVDETNILTLDAIKSVCKAERRLVTSHPLYQANCLCHSEGNGKCPTWSLGNYAALLANKTSCTEIEQEDVIRLTDLLTLCAPFLSNWTQGHGNVPPECGQHDHAAFAILYYLLPTEFSQSIDSKTVAPRSLICAVLFPIDSGKDDVLETIYEESVERKATTDGITRLKAVDFSIKYKLFKKQLYADSVYMGISAGAIFLLIWLYTGSLLVSLAAFLNMMFSLVMADFFYTVVFVRPFFPFVNLIAVILMLGVGADDTFVYVDLWKKCLSELGDRDLPRLVYETLRHASVTMLVTSLTTAAALYATAFSHIIAVRCFAVFAGTAIIMNFVLTMTLLPAVVVMQHKLTALCCSLKICSGLRQCKGGCLEILSHRVKMIYEELIPSLVLKLRYAWIILFLLLMTGGAVVIFYFPRFRLPSSSDFQFFVSSHYFEQFDFVYRKQFSFSKETFSDSWGSVVWGVQAVDNGDMWDPDDRGTLALDDGFEFSSPEDQAWLLGFCQDLREAEFYTADTLDCFIEGFVDIMQSESCESLGIDLSPCCNQSLSTYSPFLFKTCIAKLSELLPSYRPVYFRKTDSKLAVIRLNFRTHFPNSYNFSRNDDFWRTVNPWVERMLKSAPGSLRRGWFISPSYGMEYYDLQQSLATGTRTSMLITLAIASGILLLSIQNLLLTLLAMLTITSALFVTVAILVLLGWELNIVEATIITLAVGLSVDFTIHYGVAYKLSPSDSRRQRARYSLSTMTPAISLAAFSTFLAGALVLPSTVLTYHEFGVFLMMVMTVSWMHGTFFFESLCMVIGPQGSCGGIPRLSCSCCCKRMHNMPPSGDQLEQEQARLEIYDNPVTSNVFEDESGLGMILD